MIQDTQLSIKQSQMVIHDPDTQELIPQGTANLVDWIKATIKSVYPEKENCQTPPMIAKWNTPGEAADKLPMKAMG